MCDTCAAGYSYAAVSTGAYSCEKDSLPSGAIAGIVIGVLAVLGIAGGLTAYFICKSKKAKGVSALVESHNDELHPSSA